MTRYHCPHCDRPLVITEDGENYRCNPCNEQIRRYILENPDKVIDLAESDFAAAPIAQVVVDFYGLANG